MGHRLSAITTRTGDDGTTGMGDGSRISKSHIHIECIGDIDELNSSIGIIVANIYQTSNAANMNMNILEMQEVAQRFQIIQNDLFDIGAELCMPTGYEILKQQSIIYLDEWIKQDNAQLGKLQEFILPGGSIVSSLTHNSRCIARRAERHIVALQKQLLEKTEEQEKSEKKPHITNSNSYAIRAEIIQYLNRLSDWLFIIARLINKHLGCADILWKKSNPQPQK